MGKNKMSMEKNKMSMEKNKNGFIGPVECQSDGDL